MFSRHIHRLVFIFGICALAFGMMVGTVPTSIPQILLAANWLAGGRFGEKWARLRNSRLFWVLAAVYLAHVAGLFYSHDTAAALADLRTKLPLAFLPLLFLSEEPLSGRELRWVLYCFIGGSVVSTAWCHIYSFVLHNNEVVRNASRFMSHIRFGLYLNMAIAACGWLAWTGNRAERLWLALAGLYFLASMFVLGLAGGVACFFLLLVGLLGVLLVRSTRRLRIMAVSVVLIVGAGIALYVDHVRDTQLEVKASPVNIPQRYSAAGVPYAHFDTVGQRENGYFVLMNIELEELRRSWNREFPDDSFCYKPAVNLPRYEVLVRYMSSRGLMKDSLGYLQLTAQDKRFIRQGYTNHLQPGWGFFRRRAYELVNDYSGFVSGRAVNGHSFTMRLYFWKATLHAIAKRPLLGAGTGDVQAALDRSYLETGSPLEPQWRKRPHNQFLTITLALGVAGLAVFLVSLVWPVVALCRHLHILYWPFILLAGVSFLFEDTLETQAGVTFFAFFNALFLCQSWLRRPRIPADSPANR